MSQMLLSWLIVAAAAGGLAVAGHIHLHKRRSQPLVCPLGSNCLAVVHSDYSRLFGINLEILGVVYYSLALLMYVPVAIFWWSWPGAVAAGVGVASAAAFALSVYLTYVQAIKLREWCVWCLVSALSSSIIFLATLGLWFAIA